MSRESITTNAARETGQNSAAKLRITPVKDLTPSECRKLLVHNHGGSLSPERRKAYLMRGNPGNESLYFAPSEQVVIERMIEEGI